MIKVLKNKDTYLQILYTYLNIIHKLNINTAIIKLELKNYSV